MPTERPDLGMSEHHFASFDLTQDERQRFKDSIKKLEDLKQEIKLHLQ